VPQAAEVAKAIGIDDFQVIVVPGLPQTGDW
jgi:hypothetical protein